MLWPPPRFVRQLDGSPNAGENCGPVAVCHGLRWATANTVDPSPTQVRKAMHTGPGGTNLDDQQRAWDEMREVAKALGWELGPLRAHIAQPWDRVTDALDEGRSVMLQMSYRVVNVRRPDLSGDPSFMGMHSLFLARRRVSGGRAEIKVYDGLRDGRRPGIPRGPVWYPAWLLRDAAAEFSMVDGRASFAVAKRGDRVEEPAPPDPEDCSELHARIDTLEQTLGIAQAALRGASELIAPAIADIDEVLSAVDDHGGTVVDGAIKDTK